MIRKINAVVVCLMLLSCNILLAQKKQDDVLQYSMKTRWTDKVDPKKVWPEYPRPQMTRNNWVNLNGYWEYAIKDKNEGKPQAFEGRILVPFAVESDLSQVKRMVGDANYLWYKRSFKAPKLASKERLLLHFGAVDWQSTIYINGKEVGTHKGGYDPFTFDITKFVEKGEQELVVRVWDPTDNGTQARGKQVADPKGIWYTPVTGIWQTVWLETVPGDYIKGIKATPDIDERKAKVDLQFPALSAGASILVKAFANGEEVSSKEIPVGAKSEEALVELTIPEPVLWSPDNPFLYDLQVSLKDTKGNVLDEVESYFGMRKVSLGKDANGYTRIMLNDEPLFQWGLLDQGWWPDGLYTAPTEEAMLYDIEVTRDLGFNMIRKHVKVEPARFYYHCDKMGVLVWQDMPNGNYFRDLRIQAWEKQDAERPLESAIQFEREMKAMIDNFYSFPSIVVWVPFNEGWGQYDTKRVAKWVKEYDPTRLVDAPSGWTDRGVGDMIDVHLYPGPGMELSEENRASVLGEFGGLGWPVPGHLWWDKKNWGYLTYQDQETFQNEFRTTIKELEGLISWGLSGAIYTQTTDVEGEVNGLLTYDREVLKVDPKEVSALAENLFQPWWRKRVLVHDSEEVPHHWQVKFEKPEESWTEPGFDDFHWSSQSAPFSSEENPFLPPSSEWNGSELYARTTFHLKEVPERLYLKHYMPKSQLKVYVNGTLVKELNDGGGRKRHYTHELLNEAVPYLKNGENVVAVEVIAPKENGAFDIGLYTTEPVATESAATGAILNKE